MGKNIFKVVGLAVILIVFGVWLLQHKKQNITQNNKDVNVSVRMKWFFSGTMTPWFAGKEQNIFKKENINLVINSGGPENSSIKLVAAGTDIFGVAGADEVLIARNKGIPVVAIGVLFKDSPIGFISKKSKNIISPKDWSGKIIEVDFGSNAEIQYRALVQKFNAEKIKEVPYAFSLIPFIEDKVDVSVAYIMDQVVTLKEKGIDLNINTAKQYGINPYGDVVITTEKTLNENPELVKRFMNALVESNLWAIENPEKSVEYLTTNVNNLKYTNELNVWKASIPFIIPDNNKENICLMENQRWIETENILIDFNVISKDLDVAKAYKNMR